MQILTWVNGQPPNVVGARCGDSAVNLKYDNSLGITENHCRALRTMCGEIGQWGYWHGAVLSDWVILWFADLDVLGTVVERPDTGEGAGNGVSGRQPEVGRAGITRDNRRTEKWHPKLRPGGIKS